jgi:hypothetical protein
VPAQAQVPGAAETCPECGTARAGRFCERDGYDFMTATLHTDAEPPVKAPAAPVTLPSRGTGSLTEPAPAPAIPRPRSEAPGDADPAPAEAAAAEAPPGDAAAAEPPPAEAAPAAGTRGGTVVVTADRDYFEIVRAAGGPDAGVLVFPEYCPERRFPLSGERVLLGRRSRSRGIVPDIDLSGPPEDPGVSHAHAMLVPHDAGWAVVDLGSANGTYVNDPATSIPVRVPVPVEPGDRIYAGAWTVLIYTSAERPAS